MNKRQRKKAVTKFYSSHAKLTANDKAYISKYFGVKIIMSGQEISAAMKQLGKAVVLIVDNFTPMIKQAIEIIGKTSEVIECEK